MGLNDFDCLLAIGNDRFFGYGNANVRYLTGYEKSVFIGEPPKQLKRIHDVAVEFTVV